MDRLLKAVAAEVQPFLAEGRTGRITIHFSGGAKVRLEVAHFGDIELCTRSRYNEGLPLLRKEGQPAP